MEYNQDLTNRHLININNYNQIEMGPQIQRKNSYERLMNLSPPDRDQFGKDEHDQIEQNINAGQSKTDCCPQLLSEVGECCIPFKLLCPCLFCSCCMCQGQPLFKQQTGQFGLLQEWGQFKGFLQPGLNVINTISQSVVEVNAQTQVTQYAQQGMTKDNVHLSLKVSIIFRIADGYKFTYRLASSPQDCVSEMAAANLRSLIGKNMLQQIIENQSNLTQELKIQLNSQLQYWGLYVEACLLKDLMLDLQISQAMESVSIERRKMEAMLIDFQADVETAQLMKEISMIINSHASFQIRYLNTVENIINNGVQHVVILNTNLKDS